MKNHRERVIIEKTMDFAKNILSGESSGHDWWHVYRVYQNAMTIAVSEKVDEFVVGAAALLHDIADYKLHAGDTEIGPRLAGEWLKEQGVEADRIEHVQNIIRNLSFKGANVSSNMETTEGKVVQDADRLEAIGAMGIARAFTFGGHKSMIIFDPNILPVTHDSFEEYKKKEAGTPTINHFFEKLLLLKDLMNTKTAKKIAKRRHKILIDYIYAFFEECDDAKISTTKWSNLRRLCK